MVLARHLQKMGNSQATKKEVEHLKALSEKAQNSNFTLPEEEVQSLVENLLSSRARVQEWAANTISWLTKDNADNRKSMARHGCLKPLVLRLKSRDIKVQCWSVCAVGNLCIENDENKKEVMQLRGVDYILRLLKASDETVKRWACNAIGILCMENEEAVRLVSKGGGVGMLVNCLHSSNFRVNRWAAFALGNLLGPEENRHLVVKKGGLDPLVRILDSPKKDHEAKRWVANVVGLLCMKDPLARVEASKAGAIEPLVVLLRDSRDSTVVRNAAFAIANICLDNNANKAKVKMLGGLRMLLNILQTKKNADFKLQMAAGAALFNICDGDDELPEKVKEVLNKAKSTLRPEREIRKLVDLVDGSQTVAMRLVKKAPNITDLFTTLDAPPSPVPKAGPRGGLPSGNRIVRSDLNDSDTEGELPTYATPRRLTMLEEMDKRKRTTSLPHRDQTESSRELERPKGQLGRLMVTEKRKRSISANAVAEGSSTTTHAATPRGLARPYHLQVEAAPRMRRGSVGGFADTPKGLPRPGGDLGDEGEARLPRARRLTMAGDEGPPQMSQAARKISAVPTLVVDRVGDEALPLDEDNSHLLEDSDDTDDRSESFWEMLEGDVQYDHLQIQEEIGVGAFGTIYSALYNDQLVAVKELAFSKNEHVQRLVVREVQSLKLLEHPNIVRYLGLCVHVTGAYIVTELIDGGDLRELLSCDEPLPWPVRLSIAHDIASALAFIHSNGIIHRDLKSKNVLLRADRTALLCDFGFARDADPKSPLASVRSATPGTMTMKVGTNLWMAPEVLAGGTYDREADIFSFGMLLVELITRDKPPRDRALYAEPAAFMTYLLGQLGEEAVLAPGKNAILDVAVRCVTLPAGQRPTIDRILSDLQSAREAV